MNNSEKVVKHLEMIQGVVNRLGENSFKIKGWSIILLFVSGIIASIYSTDIVISTLLLLVPIVGFWILDGYFLWQERLFRDVYNDFRKRESTDFEMNPMKHINKPNRSWKVSMFSVTLNIFYGIEIFFAIGVALISTL